jgi:hypothetical protein
VRASPSAAKVQANPSKNLALLHSVRETAHGIEKELQRWKDTLWSMIDIPHNRTH